MHYKQHANALNPIDTNFMSGLQVPAGGAAISGTQPLLDRASGLCLQKMRVLYSFSYGRPVTFHMERLHPAITLALDALPINYSLRSA